MNHRFKREREIDAQIKELLESPEILAVRVLLLEQQMSRVATVLRDAEPAIAFFEEHFRVHGEDVLADLAHELLVKVVAGQ